MPTIKQMEAVYWIHTLGGFHMAAERLNTTQSTISKRVHELEADLGGMIFTRARGRPVLTARGQSVIEGFAEILALRSRLMALAKGEGQFGGRFRLGITELVSMTWLPGLAAMAREAQPSLVMDHDVDLSRSLYDRLASGRLDLVIAPRIEADEDIVTQRLGYLDCGWACAPALLAGLTEPVPMDALARLPLLLQPEGSAIQILLMRDLAQESRSVQSVMTCNQMAVLTKMAAAGLGVTYGALEFFRPYLASGELRLLRTEPRLSRLEFVVAWRRSEGGSLHRQLAAMAKRAFDRHQASLSPLGTKMKKSDRDGGR